MTKRYPGHKSEWAEVREVFKMRPWADRLVTPRFTGPEPLQEATEFVRALQSANPGTRYAIFDDSGIRWFYDVETEPRRVRIPFRH